MGTGLAGLVLLAIAAGVVHAKTVNAKLVKPYPEELQKATGQLGTVETPDPIGFVVMDDAVLLKKGNDVFIDSTKPMPLQSVTAWFAIECAAIACAGFTVVGFIFARKKTDHLSST